MKKLIALVLLTLATTAYACQTQTILVDGKMRVCTICGSVVSCM
jgi:hypothetical protein